MVGLTFPLALLLLLPALALVLWPGAVRRLVPAGLPGDWARVIEPSLRSIAAGRAASSERAETPALPLAIWCLLVLALAGPGIESGARQGFGNLVGGIDGQSDDGNQLLTLRYLLNLSAAYRMGGGSNIRLHLNFYPSDPWVFEAIGGLGIGF